MLPICPIPANLYEEWVPVEEIYRHQFQLSCSNFTRMRWCQNDSPSNVMGWFHHRYDMLILTFSLNLCNISYHLWHRHVIILVIQNKYVLGDIKIYTYIHVYCYPFICLLQKVIHYVYLVHVRYNEYKFLCHWEVASDVISWVVVAIMMTDHKNICIRLKGVMHPVFIHISRLLDRCHRMVLWNYNVI